jgi:hypothetical protein
MVMKGKWTFDVKEQQRKPSNTARGRDEGGCVGVIRQPRRKLALGCHRTFQMSFTAPQGTDDTSSPKTILLRLRGLLDHASVSRFVCLPRLWIL